MFVVVLFNTILYWAGVYTTVALCKRDGDGRRKVPFLLQWLLNLLSVDWCSRLSVLTEVYQAWCTNMLWNMDQAAYMSPICNTISPEQDIFRVHYPLRTAISSKLWRCSARQMKIWNLVNHITHQPSSSGLRHTHSDLKLQLMNHFNCNILLERLMLLQPDSRTFMWRWRRPL